MKRYLPLGVVVLRGCAPPVILPDGPVKEVHESGWWGLVAMVILWVVWHYTRRGK